MLEGPKITCPKCGATLCIAIGNEKKCNQCGHQFDLDRNPIATRAQTEKRGLWNKN